MMHLNRSLYNPVINYIPLSSGIEIPTVLNIIFFMPFGFLLSVLWNRFRKLIPTLCISILLSSIIEETNYLITEQRILMI